MDPAPPTLDPAARRRISLRVALGLGIPTAIVVAVGVVVSSALAYAVVVGHMIGQLATATWLIGAIRTIDGTNAEFMKATLGLAPVRFAVVLGATFFFIRGGYPGVPLVLSLVGTMVCGHVLQAWTFSSLGRATG